MTNQELCAWLRENSSGRYRPSADAADLIEELEAKLAAPVSTPQQSAQRASVDTLSEAVSVMLWLYRRLPHCYGRPSHVEVPILALAKIAEYKLSFLFESFAERGAAPSPAPQGEQAALNTQANV